MNLHLYKTLWGHQDSLADAVRACVTQKWAGLEGPAPAEPAQQREFSRDAELRRGAEAALECHAQFVTVIGGCDAWTTKASLGRIGVLGVAMA